MSILFAEGFDHYASAANLARMYPNMTATNWTVPDTDTPFGRGRAGRHVTGNQHQGLPRSVPEIPLGTMFGFSCHFMIEAYPAGDGRMALASFLDGSAVHIRVFASLAGNLYCTRNTTVVHYPSNRQLALNRWYHIEGKFRVGDADGSLELRVDGETWLVANNVDTRDANTGIINGVRMVEKIGNNANGTCSIDNFILWDTTGTRNNDWLGDVEVLTANPAANGTVVGWTANTGDAYAAIDDGADGEDGDTTYVFSETPGDVADFELSDLPVTPDAILAVQSYVCARKTDSGTRTIKHGIDSDGNVSESDGLPLSTTFAGFTHVAELDPDGDVAWTPASVNALKSRIKVEA